MFKKYLQYLNYKKRINKSAKLKVIVGALKKSRSSRKNFSNFTTFVHQRNPRWTFRGHFGLVDTSKNIKSPALDGTFVFKNEQFYYKIIISHFAFIVFFLKQQISYPCFISLKIFCH